MKFLDKSGFGRAAIAEEQVLAKNLRVVLFHNGQPALTAATQGSDDRPTPIANVVRRTTPPARISDLLKPHDAWPSKNQITAGPQIADLRQIFGTGAAVLQQDFSELDLLQETRQALQGMPLGDPGNHYDRMLVYIDGSSMSFLKHKDPRHIEETGTPDSWSFVVLGEFADGRPHPLEFVGWTANRVIDDSQVDQYAGATHIGSDTAEREGLLWAGLWRFSVDIDTPTFFVSGVLHVAPQAPAPSLWDTTLSVESIRHWNKHLGQKDMVLYTSEATEEMHGTNLRMLQPNEPATPTNTDLDRTF